MYVSRSCHTTQIPGAEAREPEQGGMLRDAPEVVEAVGTSRDPRHKGLAKARGMVDSRTTELEMVL